MRALLRWASRCVATLLGFCLLARIGPEVEGLCGAGEPAVCWRTAGMLAFWTAMVVVPVWLVFLGRKGRAWPTVAGWLWLAATAVLVFRPA